MRFVNVGKYHINLELVTHVQAVSQNGRPVTTIYFAFASNEYSERYIELWDAEAERFLAALTAIGNVHIA